LIREEKSPWIALKIGVLDFILLVTLCWSSAMSYQIEIVGVGAEVEILEVFIYENGENVSH
jgi:hypothetical protein